MLRRSLSSPIDFRRSCPTRALFKGGNWGSEVVSSLPRGSTGLGSEKEKLEPWSLLVVAVEAVDGVGKGRGGKLAVTSAAGG